MKREQLNALYYQRAVKFAQQFDKPEKQEFLAELAARQQFEQSQVKRLTLQAQARKRPLVLWLSLVAVLGGSAVFYTNTGRYVDVQQGKQDFQQFQQQKAQEDSTERNDHYIQNLQARLRSDRNNGDLWFELGQAYLLNNDFEAALVCFRNAQGILGERASILGAMATADYYRNGQKLSPQSQTWITQALAKDPNDSASLLVLASDAFLHNNPTAAIHYWEKILEGDNPSVDRRAVIQSIRTAEQQLK